MSPPPPDAGEPTRVLVVRHGQSEWNAAGRWQGQADPPLSDLGRHLTYPPTPDLARRVGNRLLTEPAAPGRLVAWFWPPTGRRAVALAAVALLIILAGTMALSPGARKAVADRFGLPGVIIRFVDETPAPTALPVGRSLLLGRPVTLESAQELLRDLLRANDRRVTIEEIQKRVAEHFNIKQSDMQSPRRARQVARPRQVAMFLAKQLTTRSLPEIGRKFGGRDHTTVMHAVKKVEELCAADSAFLEDVELLKRMLEG